MDKKDIALLALVIILTFGMLVIILEQASLEHTEGWDGCLSPYYNVEKDSMECKYQLMEVKQDESNN